MAIPTKGNPKTLWPNASEMAARSLSASIDNDLIESYKNAHILSSSNSLKVNPPRKYPRMPEQRNVFIRGLLLGMSAGVSELTDVLSSDDASTASSRVCAVFKTSTGREVSVLISFPYEGAVLEPGFFEELRARIRMETSE